MGQRSRELPALRFRLIVGVRDYVSSDAGSTFRELPVPVPAPGGFGVVANPIPATVVLDTYVSADNDLPELLATFDGGTSWRSVYKGPAGEGPFSYIGFTTPTQGVAILGSPFTGGGQLLMTFDGGYNWAALPFRSG